MLVGRVIGHGTAYSATGERLAYRVVRPTGGHIPAALLSAELVRWSRTADLHKRQLAAGMSQADYLRSYFACDVLKTVVDYVRQDAEGAVVCLSPANRVLGAATYGEDTRADSEGYLGLLSIDPENMGHHRNYPTFRGIGTGMVAAIAYEMLQAGLTEIRLSPLDDAAEAFWRRRGFHEKPSPPGRLSGGRSLYVIGELEIRGLMRQCEVQPDCPDSGDCVACNALPGHTVAAAAIPDRTKRDHPWTWMKDSGRPWLRRKGKIGK